MDGQRFAPTHQSPREGMSTWSAPDPNRAPDASLGPDLPVQVVEETTGWARVRCSNGWETWVDAGALAPYVFTPTHRVPRTGLSTRDGPDPHQPVTHRLDPGLGVQVVEWSADWARVRCENDWETWVDGRNLVPHRTATAASPVAFWLPIAGAALALLGGLLPWYSAAGESASAWDIEFVTLFTRENSDVDLKTGVVLLLVVLAALPLVTRRPLTLWPAAAIAAVATNIGGLGFALYFDFPEPRPDLGIGLVLTMLGAIGMAVGAWLAPRNAAGRATFA